jgi:hypothetical protein
VVKATERSVMKPVGGGADGNEVENSAARRVICCAAHLENASCVVFFRKYSNIVLATCIFLELGQACFER